MADLTAGIQKPDLAGVVPTYQAVAATDKFSAQPRSAYNLHYKNGVTAQTTGPNKIVDAVTAIPAGSAATAGFADAVHSGGSGMGATSERIVRISNSDRFRDALGFINLVHPGTLTTVTVNIQGPFPLDQ